MRGTLRIAWRTQGGTEEAVLGERASRLLDVQLGKRLVVLVQGSAGTASRGDVGVGLLRTGLSSLDERTVFACPSPMPGGSSAWTGQRTLCPPG